MSPLDEMKALALTGRTKEIISEGTAGIARIYVADGTKDDPNATISVFIGTKPHTFVMSADKNGVVRIENK